MLDRDDKKWLCEMFDQRFAMQEAKFDERFAAQEAKFDERMDQKITGLRDELLQAMDQKNAGLRDELLQVMDQKNAELRYDLNQVIDKKTEEIIHLVDERIMDSEERIERHFDIIYENRILPMIKEHLAVLPGAGKSYDLLEGRVRKLEDDYFVLRAGLAARL